MTKELLSYWVKRDGHRLGPYSLRLMQQQMFAGEIGRKHMVSADEGKTWLPANHFPEIFHTPPVAVQKEIAQPRAPSLLSQLEDVPLARTTRATNNVQRSPPLHTKSLMTAESLVGFICSTTATVFGCGALILLLSRSRSGYGLIVLSFPLLVAAVVGLVFSSIAMRRCRNGFAIGGLVLGIVGTIICLGTFIGWLAVESPEEVGVRRLRGFLELLSQ